MMKKISEPCVVEYDENLELLKAKKLCDRKPIEPSSEDEVKRIIDTLVSYMGDDFFREVKKEKTKKISKLLEFFGNSPSYLPQNRTQMKRVRLCEDVSRGNEKFAISTYCDQNVNSSNFAFTDGFKYITENYVENSAEQSKRRELLYRCKCTSPCTDNNCPCIKLHFDVNGDGQIMNIHDGKLRIKEPTSDMYTYMLLVCGELCNCPSTCPNRIENISHRLELFRKDVDCGFGIRTLNSIEMGELVMEFVGRVMPSDEMKDIRVLRYAMELFSCDNEYLVDRMKNVTGTVKHEAWDQLAKDIHIDTYAQGNIARFIQHGCYPNLIPLRVAANFLHPTEHKIFFFAGRTIVAGEELFFNYGNAYVKGNRFKCSCGTPLCRNTKNGSVWKSLSKKDAVEVLLKLHLKWEKQACELDTNLTGEIGNLPKEIVYVDEVIKEETTKLKKQHSPDYSKPILPVVHSPLDKRGRQTWFRNILKTEVLKKYGRDVYVHRPISSFAITDPTEKENKPLSVISSPASNNNGFRDNNKPSLLDSNGKNYTSQVKPRPKMPVPPPLPLKRKLTVQENVAEKKAKGSDDHPIVIEDEVEAKGTAEDPVVIEDDDN